MQNIEYIDIKPIQVNRVRFRTAVRREAYSPDRLVAWRGRRDEDSLVIQNSLETRDEFYDRASRELAH